MRSITGMIWKEDFDIPNQAPRNILIHEWVTGGGLAGSCLTASWAAEGRAMRRSIAADFAALAGNSTRYRDVGCATASRPGAVANRANRTG